MKNTHSRPELYKQLISPPARSRTTTATMILPNHTNCDLITSVNYTIKQLKLITKNYRLKTSGNKKQLRLRIYNYLKYVYYSVLIQKVYRGFLRRLYNHHKGVGYTTNCSNDTDFLLLNSISTIPYYDFFSFEEHGQHFGFTMKSFYNLIHKTDNPIICNPYTRRPLTKDTINHFKQCIHYSRILRDPVSLNIDHIQNPSQNHIIRQQTVDVFHKIDSFGHVTNITWFLHLNKRLLSKLLYELIDIWTYRARLTPYTRILICPPYGNIFSGIHPNRTRNLQTHSIAHIQTITLDVFKNLLYTSPNKDNQSLGALYILSALTLVSVEASQALSWLYNSVV
jgi:hypothetical protein